MEAISPHAAPGVLELCLQTALHELALDIIVVDAQAKLLYANRAALAEIKLGITLQVREGRLCSVVESQSDTFMKALHAARGGRRSMFELGKAGSSRMHAMIPLPASTSAQGVLTLVLSGVRHPFGEVTLTLFSKAAGLTASEREVLISLCSGLAAQDIALQRAVCISTVRTQIGSIREKVGVRTVTQVIRKVSTLPPMSFA